MLLEAIASHREALERHGLYQQLHSLARLRTFLEHHVFAVWDFMCVLKGLQRHLTSVQVPWLPVAEPRLRRLINEIVLGEESDELPDGRVQSHFELYLEAMREADADASAVMALVQLLELGQPLRGALRESGAPAAARAFVADTLEVVERDQPHTLAAVFAIGREQMIPPMFARIVGALGQAHPRELSTFQLYLERHVQLDQAVHGPASLQMLAWTCGDDSRKWAEATQVAISALESRMRLWDAILAQVVVR